MFKIIIFTFFVACYFLYVRCLGVLTRGEWRVLNAWKCPNDNKYRIKVDLHRKPVNQTTDSFDLFIQLNETVDRTYGAWIDVCAYQNGKCKPYLVLADISVELFLKRYAKNYLEAVLTRFGLEPPDFPVKPGNYEYVDYKFDYGDLPKTGMAGDFGATVYVMKSLKKIACIGVTLHFTVA